MTLEPYTSERIDQLSLRLLDSAVLLRSMARLCREEGLEHVGLNDKKALDWLTRFEEWADKAERVVQIAVRRERGVRKALKSSA